MVIASVLQTKLNIPSIRDHALNREHLLTQLNEVCKPGRKIALVSAPAGFGKTTVVVTWLRTLHDWKTGWLSLDREHNEPTRLLQYLLTMLSNWYPDVFQDLQTITDSGVASTDNILSQIINLLIQTNAKLLLIFDDYHEITEQRIHDILLRLIENLPDNIRLIITSRVDPPLPLSRMRVRDQLIELRASNLRFTSSETQSFLSNVMNIQVDSNVLSAIESRTEGWVAGLQLAALSLSKMADKDEQQQFIHDFAGSHRHVVDYLADEVLQRQSDEVLEFLLQTSILDRFCSSLCEFVTGNPNSHDMLSYLDKANLFLIPLDSDKQWFRYHHLFADLLRLHLNQSQRDRISSLHVRAAQWFEAEGLIQESIDHALDGKDFDIASRLIMANLGIKMFRGEIDTVHRWLSTLPDQVIFSHPRLCLDRARLLLLQHQIEGVDELLNVAESHLQAINNPKPEQQLLLGNLTVLRAYPAFERNAFESSIAYSQRALEFFTEDKIAERGACLLFLGHSFHYGGWTHKAVASFLDAIVLLQKVQNTFSTMMCMGQLSAIYELLGNLHQGRAILDDAFEWARIHKVESLTPVAVPHARLANILREWNALDEAEAHLKTALELARGGRPLVIMRIHVLLAKVMIARGDWSSAENYMRQAQDIVKNWQTDIERSFVEFNYMLLLLRQGKLERVVQWLSKEKLRLPDISQPLPNYQEQKLLIWARYLIVDGVDNTQFDSLKDALHLLNRLYQIAQSAGRFGILIEICILQAMAYKALSNHEQALEYITEALHYATPQGYVRIFLDEGQEMLELLNEIPKNHPYVDYVNKLLGRKQTGDTSSLVSKGFYETRDGQLLETLSERELQVLHLLAQGLSSNEVAETLVIAIETARKHLKNIYSKLDVHNKVEAVRRAQELNLI